MMLASFAWPGPGRAAAAGTDPVEAGHFYLGGSRMPLYAPPGAGKNGAAVGTQYYVSDTDWRTTDPQTLRILTDSLCVRLAPGKDADAEAARLGARVTRRIAYTPDTYVL